MPRRFQGLGEYVTLVSHVNSNSAANEADANYNQTWITSNILASEFEFHHAHRRPLPRDTFHRLL